MARSTEQFKTLLEYKEQKSSEMKRPVSYWEAIALWLSESANTPSSESNQHYNSNLISRV